MSPSPVDRSDPESQRLREDAERQRNWKRWGPYLADRQWGTVREDYSADGESWAYLTHDQARSHAYRWGEDGLLGICDRQGRLCFALALWNGRDPILKERLFGLTGHEGNHGEDVKEHYFFLDSTPTHSWLEALYKYPQAEFPYRHLVEENGRRDRSQPEYELDDTGIFADSRYFDVRVEYAKAGSEDILIRITAANRGPEAATLHLLPTLWFRNSWSWGRSGDGFPERPGLRAPDASTIDATHATLGHFRLEVGPGPEGATPELLFTENETNAERLSRGKNASPYVKDAFHDVVVNGRAEAANPARVGTKAAAWYRLDIPAGGQSVVRLRLAQVDAADPGPDPRDTRFDERLELRRREADQFYADVIPASLNEEERRVSRQAYAGLFWSKQFYYYVVRQWLDGDPAQPPPPAARLSGRNREWTNLYNRDVISMPDSWEYPWYAAWDLAFHTLIFAHVDREFAKSQLILFLREWYMQPNGQIPAYEWALGDVNPPVHAWAAWRVYKLSAARGERDRLFLERVFQKLLLNFTWWVNRKDVDGRNLFGGGFLGLDNVGVFDRSRPLPNGRHLEQADGTSWMAFFCGTMLSMALELANGDPAYEDIASKFFEHFVAIVDAMNGLGGTGLWDDQDGFYYDSVLVDGRAVPIRLRSLVGLIPLLACEVLEQDVIEALPGFSKRMDWFMRNRPELAASITSLGAGDGHRHRLLAIASRERLVRVLGYLLDEEEFLSPYGVRSLSRKYAQQPYEFSLDGAHYAVGYEPGESLTGMFGGNSNWRGPVWFPINYLLIEALERYHHFYGDELKVECPTGSGNLLTLAQVTGELMRRLTSLFVSGPDGRRPCHGEDAKFAGDPHWKDLVLFHEYFHADTGRGCGASHQTGWTALVARCLEDLAHGRS